MELAIPTVTWLLSRNIEPKFFPLLQKAGLVNVDLLTTATFHDLQSITVKPVARYLIYKLRPPKKLINTVETFLLRCGIGAENLVYFERLRVQSVRMLSFVSLQDLVDVGMDKLVAKCTYTLVLNGFPQMSKKDEDISLSDSSSEEDDDDDDDDEDEDDEGGSPQTQHQLIRHVKMQKVVNSSSRARAQKRKASGTKRARRNVRTNVGISPGEGSKYATFKHATKLHLSTYTKEQFVYLHHKYRMERKRQSNEKWIYRVVIDGETQRGWSLKDVLDICTAAESKQQAASTLASSFGAK
jgi:hypothetical protein